MTMRRPVVLVGGESQQLPVGDGLVGTREVLTADRTYYVRADGSDTNTGLADNAAGAFLTIQRAIVVATATLDAKEFQVTVRVGDGTYTGACVCYAMHGLLPLIIRGNAANATSVHVNVTGIAFTTQQQEASVSIFDMRITGSTIALNAQAGNIGFGNVEFGASSSRTINAQTHGVVTMLGNYTITGGGAHHILCTQGGTVRLGVFGVATTITLVGTPNFSVAFASVESGGGLITLAATVPTITGAATGKRFNVQLNGVVDVRGNGVGYFPGSAAGTVVTGGQYDGLGDLVVGGSITAASAVIGNHSLQTNSMELAAGATGNRACFVDLHSDDTNADYSARVLRNAGVDGTMDIVNAGAGNIRVMSLGGASVLLFHGTSQRMQTTTAGIDVAGIVNAYGGSPVTNVAAAATTFALASAGVFNRFTNAGASTCTVPANATVAFPIGTDIHIRRAAAANLTITAAAGVVVNPEAGGTLVLTNGMTVTLKKVGVNTWDLIGHTVAA